MAEIKRETRKFSHAEMLMPQEEMLEIGKQKSKLTLGVPKETSDNESIDRNRCIRKYKR